jgi:prepilin-type N-terminal cleavage/methylation domain-containing protein
MRFRSTGRITGGFTMVEMLVSIALMAVLATALGNMLCVTTYQALKARTDQKVKVLIDREVSFYTLVPYTELAVTAGKVMDPDNPYFSYTVAPGPAPTGATGVYNSFEGTTAVPMYLMNPVGGNGMYSYTITRAVSVYPDHKEIDLWIDWDSPSPNYSKLVNPAGQNGANTVHQTYSANPIYRFP